MKTTDETRLAVREVVREFGYLSHKHDPFDLTFSQFHALIEVDLHQIIRLGQLARLLGLDKSTASRIVKQLSDKRLLLSSRDPENARVIRISLTPEGQNTVKQMYETTNQKMLKALSLVAEEDREVVTRGLALYAQALKKSREAGPIVSVVSPPPETDSVG